MEPIPCCNCAEFFMPSPRHKNQIYCMKPECRRAKKASWKRNKMRTDPDYRYNHKLANQKWARTHPDYWRKYRRDHPAYVERNRILQAVRNRRGRCQQDGSKRLIAKVDASIFNKNSLVGQFYLVPVIAKVDALKVNIFDISAPYQ
jgi:hypothetical protein